MIYINVKTEEGTETLEELHQSEFKTYREYKQEIRKLLENYRQLGMAVYSSKRCTKEWRKNNNVRIS